MRYKSISLVLVLTLALAACKSAEERAEEYYQSGLELMESGDFDRAMVELRNVFELDGSHRDARFILGTILLEQKADIGGAYRQFLRVAEQFPEDIETRIQLAQLAFRVNNWEELERHGEKAIELAPDRAEVQAITIALAYRAAVLAEDAPGVREQGRAAAALLSDLPENIMLYNIITDSHLRNNEPEQALASLGWLLERDPENQIYWRQRLGILAQLDDIEGVEAQLLEMVERFPDNSQNAQALLRFYVSRDEADKAEDFLRAQIAAAEEGDTQSRADLINFLLQVSGRDAAREELENAIAEASDPVPFRVIRAGLDYTDGDRDAAIAELEDILGADDAEMPAEQIQGVRIALARMLLGVGNEVGARARVEEVLAADATHPEGLKLQANWQIQADDADAAISSLRLALDRAPEDAQAMTLMAQAYARAGSPGLSQEFLALAVEASGNAPEETLRYARILIEDERYLPAEDILLPALRLAPQNLDLLTTLGTLYLRMEDLGRAEQVVAGLRRLETDAAEQAADQLQAQIIGERNGVEDAVGYLEQLANSDDATMNNQIGLIRARLVTGEAEEALEMARDLQTENPENLAVQAIVASVEAASGDFESAIETYRDILEEQPRASAVWLALARTTERKDGVGAGEVIVREGLAVLPDDGNLLWASASFKERNGDIDGAIEIYEDLYTRNSGDVIVANNLASLLATYRDDTASLDRAWTVARRFRDVDIPAMQDTFGWILHRRGESAEALPYLESAAQGLPNDPIVQFHLGQVYQALERPDDALAQYRTAVQIAGPDDTRAQIAEARSQIDAAEN